MSDERSEANSGENATEPEVARDSGGMSKEAPGLRLLIESFYRTIEGIREVLALVAPHIQAIDDEPAPEVARVLGKMRLRQKLVARAVMYDLWGPAPQEVVEDDQLLAEPVQEHPTTNGGPGDATPAEVAGDRLLMSELRSLARRAAAGEASETEMDEAVNSAFDQDAWLLSTFIREMQGTFLEPDKMVLLNRSMLVTAVAAFETLIAGVFSQQHHLYPDLLAASEEARFSLSDLQKFASIDDARRAAVEQRVDRMMRESLESWERWLEKRAGIKLVDLCVDMEVLAELFQRRHVVVHNDSRASQQYISAVDRPDLEVGTPLPVTSEYLERALDELTVSGVALGTSAWISWFAEETKAAVIEYQRMTYNLLRAERYLACMRLCEIGAELGGERADTEIMRVNTWIARKQLHGVDAIRDDVLAWDVSALTPQFAVARLALLDELDAVFEAIPKLLESGGLEIENLVEWPLFKELRADERYKELRPAEDASAISP